jgi:lysophospholipase L1-like esterase
MEQEREGALNAAINQLGAQITKIPTSILHKNKIKASAKGDSITNGYLSTDATYNIWVNRLNHMLTSGALKTGENLFSAAATTKSAGCTESGGTFTLNATSDDNPRFTMTTAISCAAGKMYLLRATLNSDTCVGLQVAMRLFGCTTTASGTRVLDSEYNIGGLNVASNGDYTVYYVFSSDWFAGIPTVTAWAIGAEVIGGTSSGKIGYVKNIELYECLNGIAIHKQGTDGATSADGISTIAEVTRWTPDVCFIGYGTNDIRQIGATITKAQYVVNIKQIADTLYAAGVFPIIGNIPPLGADQNNYTLVMEWNTALKAMVDATPYGYWDRYSAIDGTTTYLADGRHLTTDGNHLFANSAKNVLLGNIAC